MYSINRLLVALDLSELDQTLVSYASALAKTIGVEYVYFFHVAKSLGLPPALAEKYPDLLTAKDEGILTTIQATIDQHFDHSCDYKIELREGTPADEILRWSDIQRVDMIIVGRKLQLKGSGLLPGKLARIAHCSVLFVPENTSTTFNKFLVATDFSGNSKLALDMAAELQKLTNGDIILQNSYHVPWGYHTLGKTYEEFAEIMKGHALNDATRFLQGHSIDSGHVKIVLSLDKDNEPAERAYEEAVAQGVDLIIMSSKGRSGPANLLMGSVADKMISLDFNIPLLVAKSKEENLSFFEALLKI